ncbi:hypothetical protein BD309DRAFT_983231 [Dichomitus squalens]|nr:hypothetical protein BD309DRAFT_983231 [Dichomitus squalens]
MLPHVRHCVYSNKDILQNIETRAALAEQAKAQAWDQEHRDEFNADLCDLFVACNFSFNAADNPQMHLFFTKWVPGAKVPDRWKLSGPCLDRAVANATAATASQCTDSTQLVRSNRWKNIAKTSVLTSTMNVNWLAHLVQTHDITGWPKMGQEHLEVIKSDIEYMETTYGVRTIAWVTDDGPDGKGARNLLRKLWPWMVLLLCWAHQCNLLVGEFLVLDPYRNIMAQAVEIAKWFNNHSGALDLLNVEQLATVTTHLKPLAIATNILQSSHARLDHVLFTLANLYHTYSADGTETDVREHMLSKLEARWEKNADQDLFILAGFLNLYGHYTNAAMNLACHLSNAKDKEVDILRIWKLADPLNADNTAICTDENGLSKLARRLLSVASTRFPWYGSLSAAHTQWQDYW